MSLYQRFDTDRALESSTGITIDFGDGVQFGIHRAGGSNRRFKEVMTAKLKPYRHQIDTNTLSDETATRLLAEAYADAVITSWSGVNDRDGEPLSFTRENVTKVLLDLPELFRAIQDTAGNAANFRREKVAQDAETLKND
jgi:hypothetical protein